MPFFDVTTRRLDHRAAGVSRARESCGGGGGARRTRSCDFETIKKPVRRFRETNIAGTALAQLQEGVVSGDRLEGSSGVLPAHKRSEVAEHGFLDRRMAGFFR